MAYKLIVRLSEYLTDGDWRLLRPVRQSLERLEARMFSNAWERIDYFMRRD